MIARLRDRTETTILLTTHCLDEAEKLCDRLAIMHSGRIVAEDTPAGLLASLGREIVELRLDGDAGSLAVVAAFALLFAAGAMRVFTRAALR